MYEGAPNLASVFGYTNSSWTLKADLIAGYVCRLMNQHAQTRARRGDPWARHGGAGAAVHEPDVRICAARGRPAAQARREGALAD